MPIDLPLTALPIKEVLSDIYNVSKGPIKKRFKNYITDKNIRRIYDHLRSLGKVRTIWQTDRPVPIKNFYYPQKVTFDGTNIPIKKLSDLTRISGRTIVQGIVGQGKSIFLRHLCAEEMRLKKLSSIPVFLELRKFEKGKTLTDQIKEYLEDIGLDSSSDTFEYLASNNRINILLDAYDEIEESIEKKIFKDIERLSRKYPELAIIITSRPNYPIQNSELFTITNISPLEDSDLKPILKKLCPDSDSAAEIIKGINGKGQPIKTLLTTPLMVTLLVFVYKSEQKIPVKPIEFYDSLFITVLSRHDKLKPGGVNRNKKTKISDTSFQKIFDCISFLSSQDSKTSLKEGEIIEYIEQAKSYNDEVFNSDEYLDEICKITCLIMKDGFDYNYLHKSIQEYHAAKFIESIPEESKAIDFYSSIIKDRKWIKWMEQIQFLIELDKYRCHKFFILPSCNFAKSSLFSKSKKIRPVVVKAILNEFSASITKNVAEGGFKIFSLGGVSSGGNPLGSILTESYILETYAIIILFQTLSNDKYINNYLSTDENLNSLSRVKLSTLLNNAKIRTEFINEYSSSLLAYINKKHSESTSTIKKLENTDKIFKF